MHERLCRSEYHFPKRASALVQTYILTFHCNSEKGLTDVKYFLYPLQQSTLTSQQERKQDQDKKQSVFQSHNYLKYSFFSPSLFGIFFR